MAVAGAVPGVGVGPRDHVVQFYRDEEELAGQACGYLLEVVRDGGVAVVIATRAHRLAFEAHLADAGIDVTAARAGGGYLDFDAQQTLDRFTAGGRVDAAGFDAVIGGVIRAAAGGRPVRAFGEMVALLWDAGLVAAAVELEALWNGPGRERTRQHERPERQLAGAARPVRGYERAAAHGSQRKPEKGSCDECLPARPAEHEAKARGQLGVFPELTALMISAADTAFCY